MVLPLPGLLSCRTPSPAWRCRPPQCRATSAASGSQTATEVIVVGGGVGGLATAGRLARAGLRVTLLEKNSEVGGRAQSVEVEGGYRFDTGPSLLLFPDKYREAFAGLGTSLEDAGVDVRRVGPAAYRVWFAGGGEPSSLDLLNDATAMAAQLEGVERGAGAAYARFLRMVLSNLEMGMPNFIERDLTKLEDARGLADLLPRLSSINVLDLLGQHDWRLKQFFKSPRLRALFTFQDLYVGLSPYTAPAVFGLLAGTELSDGVWYPLGGFGRVRDGLLAAAEACGVAVRTHAEVAAITTDAATGAATGVVLASGERLPADIVVCNRDLPAAYALLDGPSAGGAGSSGSSSSSTGSGEISEYARRRSRQLAGSKYSAGVIAFNWGLSSPLPALLHHNIFLSDQARQSWDLAASPAQLLARPNFYVHCPARTDPSAAPAGGDSVMVLLPVASMQRGPGDYSELVAAGRQRILDTFREAGLGDVGATIAHEHVIDPPQWQQRYGLQHGAAFGLAHGLDQLSIFRPANKDARIPGLYFVGASTRPGNGVPLCLIGAKLTAERILEDRGLASAA